METVPKTRLDFTLGKNIVRAFLKFFRQMALKWEVNLPSYKCHSLYYALLDQCFSLHLLPLCDIALICYDIHKFNCNNRGKNFMLIFGFTSAFSLFGN